jgi:hypothetical protein
VIVADDEARTSTGDAAVAVVDVEWTMGDLLSMSDSAMTTDSPSCKM